MKTLGLDLGPNSIGWALLEDGKNARLIDCGVRVFPEGVDAFDSAKESSRNEQRRLARGMRRQIRRRAQRRRVVQTALIEAGLWPMDNKTQDALLSLDPFDLRAKALAQAITPHEIGRILLHLNQRRGFLSLRKVNPDAIEQSVKKLKKQREIEKPEQLGAEEKPEDLLARIRLLTEELGSQTLGQYLHAAQHPDGLPHPDPLVRVRGKHTHRKMLEDELLAIWEYQRRHHPKLLTDHLLFGTQGRQNALQTRDPIRRVHDQSLLKQFGLHGLIFHQRPIYWPASMIGKCELEKGQKRCHRSDPLAQRFRILQEVNHLRYIDPTTRTEHALTPEERQVVTGELFASEQRTFDQIRKKLGFIETRKFNLERGERSKLKGHQTDYEISKLLGKGWRQRPESERDQIVRQLLNPSLGEQELELWLTHQSGLSTTEIEKLMSIDFGSGYVMFSRMAMEKMMPHLARGMIVSEAKEAAGYLRRDQLAKRLFEKLPRLDQIRSGPLADLNNPVVKAALYELRKVINAIIRKHGRPDEVHLEMARSLKMNQEKRTEYNKRIRDIGDERDGIAERLRESGISVSRDAILRFQLWAQQKERCVYSGQSIGFKQLFTGEIDIDHILPYSRTLDDSQSNKVVCFRQTNDEKGDRTPYEWLAEVYADRFDHVLQCVEDLPYRKRMKFTQKEVKQDDFIARQLVDTGYIATLACEYVRLLMEKDHDVIGTKGELTAELRHQWCLDDVLQELPDSPAWAVKTDLRPGEKNRADHRHHAIDAIVVALTNRSRLQKLSRIRADGGTRRTGEALDEPWTHFRQSVIERIKAINVSHRVSRKVAGALHKETLYGPTHHHQSGDPVPNVFVVRKSVEALSANEIEKIRDEGIKRIVVQALKAAGIEYGRGKKIEPKRLQAAVANLHLKAKDGREIPIRKVRLLTEDQTIRAIRSNSGNTAYVKPGSTHHLCLFEWTEPDKKGRPRTVRDAVFVSMLDATNRIKHGKDVICRTHPDQPGARFVMSLSRGEMVLAEIQGQDVLVSYRTAASTQGQIYFALHSDARRSADYQKLVFSSGTLKGRKVTVTPLGEIRWAND